MSWHGLGKGTGRFLETQVGVSGEQQSGFGDENQGFLLFSLFIYQPLYRREVHE